jgi:predicted ABC-type ATPase
MTGEPSDVVAEEAKRFAKTPEFREKLVATFADPHIFPPEDRPLSIYMAGSPGAGKTEFSKQFIALFEEKFSTKIVRIDADEIRALLPQYSGENSWQVQGAAAIGVEKLYDSVLRNRQHVILDGTLSRYEKAKDNIRRSIDKGRDQVIFFLYQEPNVAWEFTQKREKVEGRHIPRDAFIESFVSSRHNADRIKRELGASVQLNVVIKNYLNDSQRIIVDVDTIDTHIPVCYTREELEKIVV